MSIHIYDNKDGTFHQSHRAMLFSKDPIYYSKFAPDFDQIQEYIWPKT